jgi:hypothetical protein
MKIEMLKNRGSRKGPKNPVKAPLTLKPPLFEHTVNLMKFDKISSSPSDAYKIMEAF